MSACEICGAVGDQRVHRAREMMFGLRERFDYLECGGCGRLRQRDPPADLGRYYPAGYYSFDAAAGGDDGAVVGALKRWRAAAALRAPVGVVDRLAARQRLPGELRWMAGLGLRTSSRIADIGAGGGQILLNLSRHGFTHLVGFDPYVEHDRTVAPGVTVYRRELDDIGGVFDLVTVHHAFEHMDAPGRTLERLAMLLAPRGALVIRTPVADSWAWRHYGVDWVQLDAPRHLYVHTTASIARLAAACGLRVVRHFRDSNALQFWGSELYTRDLPLREYAGRLSEVFSVEEMEDFTRRAAELNAALTGDSACFVLRRADAQR